jgi:asparagine synthase (glutamine-hydrolysing)
MCGIAGVIEFDGRAAESGVIRTMTDVIAHRGPDSQGHWTEGPVALGHRRLSIIDLSDSARQPMTSADGTCVIVFNGEIYNYRELATLLQQSGYRLATHSDTEVILGMYQRYGVACLGHLRGMFAFAIWDRGARRLFVARDRVGIKPLYYYHASDRFVFASELKGVVASGASQRTVNLDALFQYMRFLVVPQPASIFRDVHKLDPGSYLLIGADGTFQKAAYWDVAVVGSRPASLGEAECIEQFESTFRESVRYHLVADVPVGAFLSGGLDSSSVVTMMRQIAPAQRIATFSTVFPSIPEYDEDAYARKVASLMGTDHSVDAFKESFLDEFDRIIWYLDEPFAVSSAYALYYLAKAAARETKVVLTGDGGDELFAGYEGYKNDAYRLAHRRGRYLLAAVYGAALAADRIIRTGNRRVQRWLAGLARRVGSEGLRYSEQVAQSSLYAMSQVLNSDIFLAGLSAWQRNLMARYYDDLETDDRLERKLYAEYKTRLVDEMLMKVDRMTMAHALEARVPLLDHKVVELAFQTPTRMKLRTVNGERVGKYVFKKVMERYLPNDIIYRRKQGFNIPLRHWMQGRFLDKIEARVLEGTLMKSGMLHRKGTEALIRKRDSDGHAHFNMLMLLYSFEAWAGAYESRFGNISLA